ncbi:lef-4 [Esparto virus]|uniref:Lef-4 n=1 Tax=Esparto virus TaxID=2072209 RepID=A0A2I7G2W5_9VIRU|nr:lef-4 [Esparto virus]AUQ43969.1 lef-4 [Esparto virus]
MYSLNNNNNINNNNSLSNIPQLPIIPTTHDEWESTISIPLTESEYHKLKQKTPNKIDVIFLFKNGTRLAARTMQTKIINRCRNLITFYQNKWYPIRRTTAIETLQSIPDQFLCDKTIYRIVAYHENNIRISYNMEESKHGVRYNIEYEIEYQKDTTYHDILLAERQLIGMVCRDGYNIKRHILSLVNLFSCVMTKVQMWHCFNHERDYIWAYKWNGIKAKLLITDKMSDDGKNLTYVWPDANDIVTEKCYGTNIDVLVNFCFLVEIMDDCMVIIEAIGALIDDDIYTTEPITNSNVLKYLKDQNVQLMIGNKPVYIQTFYAPPLPNTYDMNKYDGFIIIQDDMIIKWKIPTIDVKCIGVNTFKIANDLLTIEFPDAKIGKIYEITYNREILRERIDRIAPSSEHEYDIFKESSEQLIQSITGTTPMA